MKWEPPEPWSSAMTAAGLVDPRRNDLVASVTQLARRAGIAVETVRRMIRGQGVPDPGNVEAVASALGIDVRIVSQWVFQAREQPVNWVPPSEAALLNDDERQVLDRLIRLIVADRRTLRLTTGVGKTAAILQSLPYRPDADDYDEKAAGHSVEEAGQPEVDAP